MRSRPAPLYRVSYRQTQPQPSYVEMDEDGKVKVGTNPDSGGAIPMDVYHGRRMRWPITQEVSGERLVQLFRDPEVIALLERVHAGHSIQWDGNNNVGVLNEDAQDASDQLEERFDSVESDIAVWDVDDWLWEAGNRLCDNWKEGATLDQAVAYLEEDAKRDGVVPIGDLRKSLLDRAEEIFRDRLPGNLPNTYVAELVATGRITPQEAEDYAEQSRQAEAEGESM